MEYYIEGELNITEHPEVGNAVMHSHDVYEIYLFLEGKSDYLVEGNKYRLRKGDLIVMRRGELHINSIRSDATYKRCFVHFDISALLEEINGLPLLDCFNKRPLGEYNHYPAKDFPDNHWQSYLQAICNAGTSSEKLCYLLPFLNELHACFSRLSGQPAAKESNSVAEICKYINRDLTQDLSLEHLSEQFYISKTHLNRLFKLNVGTTVGQYINLKRLYLAKKMLQKGSLPTEVYSLCGFRDYTTFYRAFKKQFQLSPREISCK